MLVINNIVHMDTIEWVVEISHLLYFNFHLNVSLNLLKRFGHNKEIGGNVNRMFFNINGNIRAMVETVM